jgi:predicted peptidase
MQTPHTLKSPISQTPLINYWLYLPPEYDAHSAKRWPLILFLHGFGERGDSLTDLERVKAHGIPKVIENGKDLPFIAVSPQCPRQSWWTLQTEVLKTLLDDVITHHAINPAQVYLTGLSMGGYGSWTLGAAHPELFAAVAPICGGGVRSQSPKLKNVPVWAFHGGRDDVVRPYRSEEMVTALQQAGGDAKLTIYPNLDHNSWTVTYDNPELYNWFLSHQKPTLG